MSTPKYIDALAMAKSQNKTLLQIIVGLLALSAFGIHMAWRVPKTIDVNLAPDVRAGDTVVATHGVTPMPTPNVYGFAYYIWQQINRWQTDGSQDYGAQMFSMQYFVTPSCQAQLKADMEGRHRRGELRQRTRQITEIPGLGFSTNRVIADGSNAWTVLLDMQVMETFAGQPVKNIFIRYPIRVVKFDVDRERNPWQLAVDCYGGNVPARLDPKDLQQSAKELGTQPLAAPRLPSTISPSSLPAAVDGLETDTNDKP